MDTDWELVLSYAGLVCLATVSVYCGAFGSLPPTPRGQKVKQSLLEDEDEDEDDELDVPERMSTNEAWLFPVVASACLFGMYVVLTYVGKEWINWILGWYFAIVGVGSVWKCSVSLARCAVGRERWRALERYRLILLRGPLEVVSVSFRMPTLALLPVSVLPSILYRFGAGSHASVLWTDVLALSFSHNALSILKLDSFQTGCILLSGLFVYDVYWVFGTEVMIKVATSLDVPIKLLWPKSMGFSSERGNMMLGLGDVVLPGIFIALALRYDHARAAKRGNCFKKPYFMVTLTGYVLGLVGTVTMLHTYGKGQPALLYLSPACILSLVCTAVVRGELEDVWRWSDDGEEKGAQATSVATGALGEVENGNSTPQPSNGADGRGHVDGEMTEGDEEGTDEVRRKKRKNRGKKV